MCWAKFQVMEIGSLIKHGPFLPKVPLHEGGSDYGAGRWTEQRHLGQPGGGSSISRTTPDLCIGAASRQRSPWRGVLKLSS